jgi:hypothetical protein
MRANPLLGLLCAAGCYTGVDAHPLDASTSGADGDGLPSGSESGDAPARDDATDVPAATRSGLRRLTATEYDNTVRDLVGDETTLAALYLPADLRAPFDNEYTGQIPSAALVEGADLLAGDIAQRLLADPQRRDAVVGCAPTGPGDEACMRSFVERLGRRAFRRPLDEEEVTARVSLLAHAEEAGDFWFAVDLALRSLLTDPAFLYRVEVGQQVAPGVFRLDGFEVATRLSYLVWGSTPDDELIDLAAAGSLDARDDVLDAARRLLDDPRAVDQAQRFHAMWLGYEGLAPAAELSADARQETEALFERVVGGGAPWRELFTFDETYVTDALAEHYGLPAPAASPGWVAYGDSGRAGLLSHASFLGVGADGERTSPTARGVRVREQVLCEEVAPPPPDVNPTLPTDGETNCKHEKYAQHVQGGCAVCHVPFDGIGFGLERYDGLGRSVLFEPDDPMTEYDESSCELMSEGEVFVGEEKHAFSGPGQLAALLADAEPFAACMLTQFYRFAVGRHELDDEELRRVDRLATTLGPDGFTFADVVLGVVGEDAFLHRREDELEE